MCEVKIGSGHCKGARARCPRFYMWWASPKLLAFTGQPTAQALRRPKASVCNAWDVYATVHLAASCAGAG